jgi:hypothetical protein
MTDRLSVTRKAAVIRNIVSIHPSLAFARGCSGRLNMDNRTLTKGFLVGAVRVVILTITAEKKQKNAANSDKGASHGGGNRNTAATPAMAAIRINIPWRGICINLMAKIKKIWRNGEKVSVEN